MEEKAAQKAARKADRTELDETEAEAATSASWAAAAPATQEAMMLWAHRKPSAV